MERRADYLLADAKCPIPGAVFGGENIPLVCSRDLLAGIECYFQRGSMGIKDDVRRDDAIFKLGRLPACRGS